MPCQFIIKDIIRDTDEQDEEGHTARSRGFPAQGRLSPWIGGVPPSQRVDAFINPEAHRISLLRVFLGLSGDQMHLELSRGPTLSCLISINSGVL